MDLTSAPFRREPRVVRPLRFAALLLLALAVTLIATLLLLSAFPLLHSAVSQLIAWNPHPDAPRLAGWLTVAFIVCVPTALLFAMWRFRLRSWWWVAGGWLVVAPVLAYLATDESALRHSLTLAEVSPNLPDAEKSFAVLMRYGRHQPAARAFQAPVNPPGGFPYVSEKPAEWRAFVLTHRAAFAAEWAALAPQRAWWAELNAFERIGDLTPPGANSELIAYPVFRAVAQRAWAIASLQALDGHGDAAIDTLLPILEVGRKMQPAARTLVRLMIGIAVERTSIHTARWILDHSAVSPATRLRLSAALAGAGGELGARRLVTVDYLMNVGDIVERPLGDFIDLNQTHSALRLPLNLLGPFVYNRRAAANLYGDHILAMQDLAARRAIPELIRRQDEFINQDARPRFKNFMGALVVGAVLPTFTKVVEAYWKMEDDRAALLAHLAK